VTKKNNLFTEKKVKKMATASFDKDIVIEDEKTINILLNGLSKESSNKILHSKVDIEKEIKRGKSALRKFSSRSKKSY
jgi:hypothetical protein